MFANRGVVTGGKTHDEIVRMRSLGGGDDLGLTGAEFSKRDIFADRAPEQMHDLADIGDLLA